MLQVILVGMIMSMASVTGVGRKAKKRSSFFFVWVIFYKMNRTKSPKWFLYTTLLDEQSIL
jgi:hypothetical protein